MVVFGGYDSYILEWLPMALALRDAGLDTIIFDGPGQGTALDDGIPMTPDWHLPVAAIVDHFALADFTLMGFSLGGALVIRAAAREPRVSRVIAMDICTSLFEAATEGFGPTGLSVISANSEQMPAPLVNAAVAAIRKSDLLTDWVIAQGEHVMGVTSPAEVFHAWREYRTDDISSLITQPVLLMAGAKDHYMPLHMLPDQLMTLTAAPFGHCPGLHRSGVRPEPLPDRQHGPGPQGDPRLAGRNRWPDKSSVTRYSRDLIDRFRKARPSWTRKPCSSIGAMRRPMRTGLRRRPRG